MAILLYGCESWMLLSAELERQIPAIGISYAEHKTNEYVWQQVNILAGHQEILLSVVVICHGSTMPAVMMHCQNSYYREQYMVLLQRKTT